MKSFPITQEGLDKLKEDLKKYQALRPEAVLNLKTAREMGDLSENAAYHAARQRLSQIDYHIRTFTYQIKMSQVVNSISNGTVQIGSSVIIDDGKGKKEFHIVGGYESDPNQGKISVFSPIGKALLGKKTGEEVKVQIPAGEIVYIIKSVS